VKVATAPVVGREAELAVLAAFLASDRQALLLEGGPGIGKTTLWEESLELAEERGMRVLRARAGEAEAQLSFAGLADLLDGIDVGELGLPPPQRRALDVALFRANPEGSAPELQAIALGVLGVLRALVEKQALVIAVDDAQWLDAPSAEALAFAAQRARGQPVRFVLSKRTETQSAVEQALELEQLAIEPLSLGAVRRILFERLGLALPRRTLRRVFDATRGNPLFALEVGRTLADRGPLELGEDVPVPDAVEELVGTRVAELPAAQRKLLLALALSAELRVPQAAAIGGVEEALGAGIVVLEGERLRPSHPLLAAAAKAHASTDERRELHLALAAAVDDPEVRARHLAMGTDEPHAELAATVARAAGSASARLARTEAVELAEHALRLTPDGSPERDERLLALGEYLAAAGEPQRVTDLIAPEVESLPAGPMRARGWLLLTEGVVESNDEIRNYLERAHAESASDPGLHAAVLAELARDDAVIRVARLPEAEARALEALEVAEPEAERSALYALAWARSLRGQPIDDLRERFRAVPAAGLAVSASPERVAGQRLVWRGEVDEARTLLTELLSLADERGEPYPYALMRLHMCELELRVGRWDAAAALLDEWAESSDRVMWPMYERCRALLAAGRGQPEEAEEWAAKAIAASEATGMRWDLLEASRARGIAALFAHQPERAVESLRGVWEHTEREGVEDPGTFPVAPDLVEALVELGELEQATEVSDRLRVLAEKQRHPWGLATAKRCAGLLSEAADDYTRLGLRFDSARTLLALGRRERRGKQWGAARRALESAAAVFDEIGSVGWAEQTRSELARIGARKPRASGELTPSEQRVVELAVQGLSNKEIAQELVVTVNTVETHLSRAYSKLGVHSRSQLPGRLSSRAH
jgi:DNA-binding CsgD family transcriptional regulator